MLQINVDKRSIKRLEDLSNFIDSIPNKIKMANSRAATNAAKEIHDNLTRRGRPGEAVGVYYEQYGDLGLRFKLQAAPGKGGYNGGRSKSGRYSILIAARIFLNAEEGKVGRRAFTLPARTTRQKTRKYRISHTSGEWKQGEKLNGPLKIPALGPFYFSAKSGMPKQKISVFARQTIKTYINKYYDNVLKRAGAE